LIARLAERAPEWDWLCWRGVRQGSSGESVLAERRDVQFSRNVVTDHVLPLAGSWEEFKSRCPRNVKESLRKCYNSLKREGHDFELEIASRPGEVEDALADFFRLHRARSQANGTVAHRDVFGWSNARQFLLEVAQQFADAGTLRIFRLRIGDAVVASRIGFVVGESLYLYYSGYDPEWGRHSVMTTAVAEAIRYAIEQGFRTVNLSTGTDVSKTRWRPEQITFLSARQSSPSLRGRVMAAAYRAARPLMHPWIRKLAAGRLGRHSNWSE
jgi:CelD/BcsL family acetyltransferase involved in cellulose biosynthesis